MLIELYDVMTGLSSQETNTITVLPSPSSLSSCSINAHAIEPIGSVWDKTAKQVMQEHSELWEMLAQL